MRSLSGFAGKLKVTEYSRRIYGPRRFAYLGDGDCDDDDDDDGNDGAGIGSFKTTPCY